MRSSDLSAVTNLVLNSPEKSEPLYVCTTRVFHYCRHRSPRRAGGFILVAFRLGLVISIPGLYSEG